ncbi:MAG: pseudouridine synthase [Burkholderiaceae bacterium]|nr:pseudouridine synthase [Burkholderiaceae bacterium]
MATLKIKPKNTPGSAARPDRTPVRGVGMGVRRRPTLAEAQAERAKRDAQPPTDQPVGRSREASFDRPKDPRSNTSRGGSNPSSRPPSRAPFDTPPRDAARPAARAPFQSDADRGSEPRRAPPSNRSPRPSTRHRDDPHQTPQPRDPRDRQIDRPPIIATPRFPVSPPVRPPERLQQRPPERPPQRPAEPRRRPVARPARDDDNERGPFHHQAEAAPGSLRLSKRMSELGLASRREADEWIEKGWVRVDGEVVKELGSRVMPDQRITIDARAKFQQAQKVTVLIHKPIGYVSGQAEDGYEPAVVLVKPENQWSSDQSGTRFLREHLRSLVPAGRLDIDSTGLLVLTQDGRIAKQLIGEDSEIEKEYLVRVAGPLGQGPASSELPADDLARLRHGLELDGEALKPAVVEWQNDDQLRFVLQEGKKRQIRRMCEAVGLKVLGLKRVRIGSVMLGDLPAGQWRYLRGDEVFG